MVIVQWWLCLMREWRRQDNPLWVTIPRLTAVQLYTLLDTFSTRYTLHYFLTTYYTVKLCPKYILHWHSIEVQVECAAQCTTEVDAQCQRISFAEQESIRISFLVVHWSTSDLSWWYIAMYYQERAPDNIIKYKSTSELCLGGLLILHLVHTLKCFEVH